jgi:hypothetical protein
MKATAEKFKRISLNVEPEMHKRIRVACAEKGIDMASELRRIIYKHFPEPESKG